MVTFALNIHMYVHTTTNNQHSEVAAILHGSPQTVVTKFLIVVICLHLNIQAQISTITRNQHSGMLTFCT